MLDSMLGATGAVTLAEIALCAGVSLGLGLVIAVVYMRTSPQNKRFAATLALLPALIQSVIMVVNGNLGAGVAVMGAFGLIRFRSAPGTAKEITSIFFAMAVGLAAGMGYLLYAALFTLAVSIAMLALHALRFGQREAAPMRLKVVIPEDVDYTTLFDDLFAQYTTEATLERVRTTNLGGLFELQYAIALKSPQQEKAFLDLLRQRNGNLSLTLSRVPAATNEL